LALSSSSLTSMVSMLELTVVVSTDNICPILFHFFFLASAVWVAAIVAAAREAGILPRRLPRVPRRECGDLGQHPPCGGSVVITPHRRIGDVLLDGRLRGRLHVRRITDLVTVLLLIAQWCGAPIDALTTLKTRQDR
jgi:hypothetical protein